MRKKRTCLPIIGLMVLLFVSCAVERNREQDIINDTFPEAQAELHKVIQTLAKDIMNADIEGLQSMHLISDKFTKFGPRRFDRQDVKSTNDSEADFFGSISNTNYEIRDLKIDVFGDLGIVTYYPNVSFVQDGEKKKVNGRQTLVFIKTKDGWKIVHEHGTVKTADVPK